MNSASANGGNGSMTALHVYTAIAEITAKLSKSGISKDRKNEKQGYKFRGIDDVYNHLAPLLAEHKLCIIPRVLSRSVVERTSSNGNALFYVVLDVEFDLVSALDGSQHTARVCGEAMDSGDKATNKAMSAAYKYLGIQCFCIPTEGDNDADAATHEVKGSNYVDPRGDLSGVSAADIDRWVSDARHAVSEYGSDETRMAEWVKGAHEELKRADDLYIAVADRLASEKIITKAVWRQYVRSGNGQERVR